MIRSECTGDTLMWLKDKNGLRKGYKCKEGIQLLLTQTEKSIEEICMEYQEPCCETCSGIDHFSNKQLKEDAKLRNCENSIEDSVCRLTKRHKGVL